MKNLFFGLFLAIGFVSMFTSCKEDDPIVDTPKTIVDVAKGNTNLSILVDAVVHAELATTLSDDTKKYTVFAPTNAAFTSLLTALGKTKITDVDKNIVKQILLYHVLGSEVKAADIKAGYVGTALPFGTGANASPVSLLIGTTGGVSLNKDIKVVTTDVPASNGVVHVIDKVLTIPTVVTHALNNPIFSKLVLALTDPRVASSDYVNTLSGAGPFTVFAPTNDAFDALFTELGVSDLSGIDAPTLTAVLNYHVLAGANVLAATLTQNQEVTTLGGKFNIDLAGGAKIKDARGRVAKIIATDVQGDNGVVHAIDKVILP
jgi:uncharacterized surface protein with fasciclin (FAS1) repeats